MYEIEFQLYKKLVPWDCACLGYHAICNSSAHASDALNSQLSPEIFDPRKVDPKPLEANFEYFMPGMMKMNRTIQAIFSFLA